MADLASLSLGDAYVDIMGNTNKLASDLARAQGMVSSFVGGVGKTIVAGIGAAFLTAGGVVAASFKSWMDEERGMARMSNVFESVGMNAGKMSEKIENLASSLMRQTTMTDNSIRAMAAQAAQMGVGEKNIEGFIKAAVGLGAQAGIDPENMMRPLVRASQGYMRNLLMLFPQIDKTASKQTQFNQIMQIAAQGMRVAAKETNTLWGAFKQLRNAFGKTLDSLGKGLFEKSGLNKEIKKVTASIFAIVDALDRGFSTKAFKGFSFEGLGDWISKMLIRFTAMLMTLPDAFKVLKEIFSNPDKLINILGEGMVSVGTILIISIVEGLKAMRGLFEGLGKILVSVFAEGLMGLPIIGKKVSAYYGQKYLDTKLSGREEFNVISGATGGIYKRGYRQSYEDTDYGTSPEYIKAKKKFIEDFAKLMPDAMKEMRDGDFTKGVSETLAAIPGAVSNMRKALDEELKRINARIKTETNVDMLAKYHQRVNELTARYGLESKKVGAAGAAGGIDMGGGVADKASFSIISMSDQWKKMQEGITKNKEEVNIRKATETTAKNTDKMVQGIGVLINKFDGNDSSAPLFAAGY